MTTSNFREGMIVADDCVFLGQLLVKKGTRLKTQDIMKLNAFGVDNLRVITDETSVMMEIENNFQLGLSSLNLNSSCYTKEEIIEEALNAVSSNAFVLKEMFALKQHSNITFKHSVNTAICSIILSSGYDLELDDIYCLTQGALLHDIGKLYAPSGILEKNDRLTAMEYEIITNHTESGYRLLLEHDIPTEVARVCLEHHENVDGSGYPRKMVGSDAALSSRLVHVADVFDALCSQRSYKLAYLPSQALDYLRKHQGRLLDFDVVQNAISNFQALAVCYQR